MRDRIFITETDHDNLSRLIQRRRAAGAPDLQYLETLEQELDRAEIVDADAIPADIVTMNSEVRLQDLDSGEVKVYRLVFPNETRSEHCVSVLAPVGTALLGYRVGDVIEWRVPKGIRHLKILAVLYQPEAAAEARGA